MLSSITLVFKGGLRGSAYKLSAALIERCGNALVIPNTGEPETGFPEVCWPASLTKLPSSELSGGTPI